MKRINLQISFLNLKIFVFLLLYTAMTLSCLTPPPLPLLPFPSTRQLTFQRREQAMFFHFGVNTFADQEQGDGTDDPSIFNPEGLDARQWVREAKNAGFKIVILTAKHADGFCLWPSAYTNYSVKSSPWKNGTGDVVRELANAAKEEGLELGLYMSPWDRHEPSYGDTVLYNEHYLGQLQELLTICRELIGQRGLITASHCMRGRYGPISEVWLDGNKGPDSKDMNYLFETWFAAIHQMQPNANIFSDAGPDVRWVGDESGEAATTSWSMMNRSAVTIGGPFEQYLNTGDSNGCDWVPPECDVSIRPGWFWHSHEQPKTVDTLLDIYYKSVGRNCVLLLNIPPNRTGLLHETDVNALHDFKKALDSLYSQNLASQAHVSASSTRGAKTTSVESSPFQPNQILSDDMDSYWVPEEGLTTGAIQLDMGSNVTFNVVKLQEAVYMGQRVQRYHVDVWQAGAWKTVVMGTTIGYKRLNRIQNLETHLVRVTIDEARGAPLISSFGLYLDAQSKSNCMSNYTNCLS